MPKLPVPQEYVRIAPYTSMRVGGTVRYLYRPESEEDFAALVRELSDASMPFLVIGGASNLLFPDEDYPGAVILTTAIRSLRMESGRIVVSCGVSLSALATFAQEQGKSGLAFAYGIPGTVGGGVYMNAGAYGGEISDCFEEALCMDRSGRQVTLKKEDLRFAYRHSALQENGLLLLHAVFSCPDGDSAAIRGEMERNMASRREKQPLEFPSCGSAFKRPVGHYAGALIEQAGLKGFSIGGAQVSEKHAGFVINRGGATSADVRALLEAVRETVLETFGVELEPEIRILSF
ncbi:MAG: UDP-N-acetylmuramate dehydrogenase [Oscillospiraceae bacterium]|nr:UDP-N-acetylmuramate dehydrogenase [Oscillospiraceae bacterium]